MVESVCVNIDEPPKLHPLQVNEYPGPKGAYEMKKIENGYYLRVDMPGVSVPNLEVIRDIKHKEIRFQGFSKNIHEVLSIKDSNRFYVVAVKVEEGEDFDRVKVVEHQIKNGTCRALITGLDHASLYFRTPPPKKSPDEGSSSSSSYKDSKAPVNENPSTTWPHPYIARIDGITIRDRHSDDCTCCHGKGRQTWNEGLQNFVMHDNNCECCDGLEGDITLNGPWSEEAGRINPFISEGVKGVFETTFNRMNDDYYMYFRLDMPDCAKNLYKVDTYNDQIIVQGQRESLAEWILDDKGGREYFCKISLKCDCCSFDSRGMYNMHQLQDGVLSLLVRIIGNNNLVIKEDRISNLPDELLSKIMSFLPTKEAVATSILGRRWRDQYIEYDLYQLLNEIQFVDFACDSIGEYDLYQLLNGLTTVQYMTLHLSHIIRVPRHFDTNRVRLMNLKRMYLSIPIEFTDFTKLVVMMVVISPSLQYLCYSQLGQTSSNPTNLSMVSQILAKAGNPLCFTSTFSSLEVRNYVDSKQARALITRFFLKKAKLLREIKVYFKDLDEEK